MEKSLKLYIRKNGVDEIPFPNEQEQATANSFTYNAARMGDAPSLSLTVMHTLCLDNEWTKDVYVKFNGEKYYLRQTPTSSFDNNDSRYKHEVEMVSERVILNDVYFFDVVSNKYDSDKPISNSSNVVFFGDIHEFANRLRASLAYSNLDYEIVIDEGVSSEGKLMSFDNMFFSNVLQEIYNTYELPYYFVGKTIHIGEYENKVSNVFEYGSDKSLLSVTKSNANFKVVNRCTGVGSSDNIPYYYPNPTPYGELAYFYNGVKTDQIRVFDWGRFARCGVDGKLEYTHTKNFGETVEYIYLDDFATYEVKRIMTIMDRKVYGWVGVYDIEVTIANGVLVGAIGNSHDDAYYKLEIRDEDDIFLWEGTMLPAQGLKLPSKKYKLYATFSVGGDDINAEATARRYGYLSLSLKTEDYEVESWELNGVATTLNSLGIQYTGGAFNVGDTISFAESKARVAPSANLMPWIYRRSDYVDRFYNAENHSDADNTNHQYDAYKDGQGGYYKFNNPYVVGWPKEHIVEFPDIKPTIEGVIVDGEHINTIVDFAYDLYDNDEIDENNNYKHPYFFAKLRRFDFNLFTHAIEGGAMTISMTSGPCGACKWTIGVDDSSKLNPVQVDDYGNLLRDDNGNVIVKGAPQDRQNDTERYSVWVALKKEESTFGVVMPNASNPYRPNTGDSFVILDISLPQSYITNAEQRLAEAIVKYMSENNDEKFNFGIKLSRIYLEENPDVLQSLNENSKVTVKYNNKEYDLHVSSYSYKKTENEALPEVSVELSDTLTVSRGVMQNTINAIKGDINNVRTQYKEEVEHATEKKANRATTLAGYGITDAFTMSEARDEFMSTRSSEDITGVKNFADGLKIGGLHIRYDVPTDSFIFPANVLIEKGLASYSAIDNDKIMSIFDGLPIDNDTLQWQETEGGKILVAVGGGSGGGLDEDKLQDYLDEKKYVTESWVTGKNYALKSDLDTVSTKLNNFLEGSNSDTIINKWSELEVFLSGLAETDNLAEILSTKFDKADFTKANIKDKLGIADWALSATNPSYTKAEAFDNFVSRTTAQDISVVHNFKNGIKLFGKSPFSYNATKDAWELDGNLVITKGLATYTKLAGFTNLDVMGGIKVDRTSIYINDNGELAVVGGAGGGGLDESKLKDYLDKEKYVTQDWVAGQKYFTQANFTKDKIKEALGINDWALAASKPSYAWSEITSKPSYIFYSKNAIINPTDTTFRNVTGYAYSSQTNTEQGFGGTTGVWASFYSNNYIAQMQFNYSSAIPFVRVYDYSSSAWSDWKRIALHSTFDNYVPLATAKDITAIHNFVNGVKIGGKQITYDSAKNALVLPFNVIVEGGLATYTKLSGFTNLDVMGGVVTDGTTIHINSAGQLEVIGGTGGGGSVSGGDYLPLSGGTIDGNLGVTGRITVQDHLLAEHADNPWLGMSRAGVNWFVQVTSKGVLLGKTSSTSIVVDASGNLTAVGAVTENSDRKLKNIEYEGEGFGLDALKKVKVAKWKWKNKHDNRLHIGGVADNLAEVMPEVVFESQEDDGTTTSSIAYGKAGFSIAASLIAPVARHEDRIKELEKNIEKMQNELNKLKKSA